MGFLVNSRQWTRAPKIHCLHLLHRPATEVTGIERKNMLRGKQEGTEKTIHPDTTQRTRQIFRTFFSFFIPNR